MPRTSTSTRAQGVCHAAAVWRFFPVSVATVPPPAAAAEGAIASGDGDTVLSKTVNEDSSGADEVDTA